MRLAQVCADSGIAPGSTKGAAQHLRGLAAGLLARGHDVTTYSARAAEGAFPSRVVGLDALAAIESGDVDVLYERYALGHRGGLDVARRLGVPFVLEVNAPLVEEATAYRATTVTAAHADLEEELLVEADLVITVSGALRRWAAARRSRPTVVVANGFEPTWFPESGHAQLDITHPLVFLGHPKPWHGADRLVHLLVDLAASGRHPSTLIIGGGPGADLLTGAAERHGVGDQLQITGALPPADASALLRHGAIGLAPYPRLEPFYFCPLKIVDYLAAGLAVVATRQGDIPALVGDAGVVVDPDDQPAFVEAVIELLDNPGRRAAMGAAGRERAMGSMTWGHVAERTADHVAALLDSRVAAFAT